jgi:hypothetical protein
MAEEAAVSARPGKGLHWGWVLAIVFALLMVCGVMMSYFIASSMKKSDAYRTAAAALKADPGVEKAIGHPIETGWVTTGNISTRNAEGNAQLRFSAEGPRGKGQVSVALRKRSGEWRVETGQFVVEGTREQITFGSGSTSAR